LYIAAIVAAMYFVSLYAVPATSSAFSAGPQTVKKPKLILRPFSTSPGKSVKVTGLGFTDSSTVTVTLNGTTVASGVAINSTGGFVANFTVPSTAASGTYVVTAKDASGLTASNNLSVSTSTKIKLSTSGSSRIVGSTVTVTGTDFDKNAPITVTFGSTKVASTTSTSTGTFSTTFQVPADPAGSYTVSATDGTNTASATFTIHPHITTTKTVTPGETITVTGTGFGSATTVNFTFSGTSLGSGRTTDGGSFSQNVQIPSTATKGGYTLQATDALGNTATFHITVS
jgi:hypothetical protein